MTILEEGSRREFKECVLENVLAWTYQCNHTRVLSEETIRRHGGKPIDFGICDECKAEEGQLLYDYLRHSGGSLLDREGQQERLQEGRAEPPAEALMQHVWLPLPFGDND